MGNVDWIKITTNMFEDEKIRSIRIYENRDAIYCIWIRLLLQAGKLNEDGLVFLSKNMPYSNEMLACVFDTTLENIKSALKVLSDLGMIKILEDNTIIIVNWEKHQNIEGMKRIREQTKKRVEKHREKNKNKESQEVVEAVENKYEYKEGETTMNKNWDEKEDAIVDKDEYEVVIEKEALLEDSDVEEENLENKSEYGSVEDISLEESKKAEESIFEEIKNRDSISNWTKAESKNNIEEKRSSNTIINKVSDEKYLKNCNASVTEEDSFVTLQKEIKNKIKNENIENKTEINNMIDNNIRNINACKEKSDLNYENKSEDINISKNQYEKAKDNKDIHMLAANIFENYKGLSANIAGLNINAIKLFLESYEEKYINLAIKKTTKARNPTVYYVGGILRNWESEGYPEEMKMKNPNGKGSKSLDNKSNLRFINFEPRDYDYEELEKKLLGW